MSIYSTLFAAVTIAPIEGTTIFEVPADQVCVIRDIEVSNYSGSDSAFTVIIQAPGFLGIAHTNSHLVTGETSQFDGRVVVPGTGIIQISSSTASCSFVISGYLLS